VGHTCEARPGAIRRGQPEQRLLIHREAADPVPQTTTPFSTANARNESRIVDLRHGAGRRRSSTSTGGYGRCIFAISLVDDEE